jgi:hypothetical protein
MADYLKFAGFKIVKIKTFSKFFYRYLESKEEYSLSAIYMRDKEASGL